MEIRGNLLLGTRVWPCSALLVVLVHVVAIDPQNKTLKFGENGSVTAEILMTLSSRWRVVVGGGGGGGGGVKSFSCQTQLLS